MKSLKLFLVSIALLILGSMVFYGYAGAADPPPKPKKVFNWTRFKSGAPTVWYEKDYKAWTDYLKEQTNGGLIITHKFSGELPYKYEDAPWIVSKRKVEIGYAYDVQIGGYRDWVNVSCLPLMFENRKQSLAGVDQVVLPFWNKMGEKDNFIILEMASIPSLELWAKFKIASLADVKNKKIRGTSITEQEFIKELGGIPVNISFYEVAMAAARGVCEGACTNIVTAYAYKWHEIFSYCYQWGITMGREITLLNREAFLELPKEWQDLVIKSAKTMLHDRLNKGYGTELAEAIRGSEAGGRVKFIDVSPADREKLAALGKKIQQEWMQQKGRSPEAKELYESILNFKKGWKEGG